MIMRYLATGCFQRVTADFVEVSTSSANRFIHRVYNIIASSYKEHIKFLQTEVDIQTTKQKFYAYCQSPGIIGSIDCTYAPIQTPGGDFAEIHKQKRIPSHQCTGMTVFPLSSNLFSRGLQVWMRINGYTFRGSNSSTFIFAALLNWCQLLKEKICCHRSKFFPL